VVSILAVLTALLFLFNNCSDTGVLKGGGGTDLSSGDEVIDTTTTDTTTTDTTTVDPPTIQTQFISDFSKGTKINTFGSLVLSIDLGSSTPSGEYLSPIYDAGAEIQWDSFTWTTSRPYGKELLSFQSTESAYDAGNVSMASNKILLHLNENGNPTSFDDVSMGQSQNHNFTCAAATCPIPNNNGVFLNSLTFDRADTQFIEAPHNDELLIDNGTISLWFLAANSSGTQVLFSKDAFGYQTGGHLTLEYRPTGIIRFRLQSTLETFNIYSPAGILPDVWHHLVVTFGTAGMKLFIDGSLIGTNAYTGGMGTTSGGIGNFEPMVLGVSARTSVTLTNAPLVNYLNGELDEFALFSRQISNAEVLDLYRRGIDRVNFEVRSCSTSNCNDQPNFAVGISELLNQGIGSPTISIGSLAPDNRYFQYKAIFNTDSVGNSPVVKQVQIDGTNLN